MTLRTLRWVFVALGIAASAPAAFAQSPWNSVTLTWTTPGDDGTLGTASQFDLRYSTSPITAANFASATRWNSTPVPLASGSTQNETVTGLSPSTTYYFAIKAGDEVPNWAAISNVAQTTRETESSSSQTLQTASQLAGLSKGLLRLIQPRDAA